MRLKHARTINFLAAVAAIAIALNGYPIAAICLLVGVGLINLL